MNFDVLYEQMMNEQFEKQIYSGLISEEKLQSMMVNGQLTDSQIEILKEAGIWAGLKNAAGTARNIASNAAGQAKQAIGNAANTFNQNVVSPIKQSYQEGRAKQIQKNNLTKFIAVYKRYIEPELQNLYSSFGGKDTALESAINNIADWTKYMANTTNNRYQLGVSVPEFMSFQQEAPANATSLSQNTQNNATATQTTQQNPAAATTTNPNMATQTANSAMTQQPQQQQPQAKVRRRPARRKPRPQGPLP